MSVNTIQQGMTAALSANQQFAAGKEKSAQAGGEKETDVSATVELGGRQDAVDGTYGRPKESKGLSADEIKALKDSQAANQARFLQSMMQANIKKQADQAKGFTKLNFDGVLVDMSEFELPAGGTTPEEAQKAISEGGAYSVAAVADRIFGMAEKLANGDLEKLSTLRDAVSKGFEQAGLDFEAVTQSKLPQISQDTHDEIMNRFDKLEEQLNTAKDETAAGEK